MTRYAVALGLLVWLGATLLLAEWRRFARPSLAERLRPYVATAPGVDRGVPGQAGGPLRLLAAPVGQRLGDRAAAVFGVDEPAAVRLRRIHSRATAASFRARQLAWSAGALAVAAVVASVGLPAPVDVLALAGAPLLAFLVIEQRLTSASDTWRRALANEVPVVGEQLAMLLNAGYSLGSAVNRIAERGRGCSARDLARVANRVRQGVDESRALREWAEVARVTAVDRLVAVLILNAEAGDLGRLVSAEARQGRRDAQRRTTELIERRAQQVWVPVTVATLVPGVILLAVPFLAALRLFSNA